MSNKLKICVEERSDLQAKFDILVNAHCELLKRTSAMAHMTATQATQQPRGAGQSAQA